MQRRWLVFASLLGLLGGAPRARADAAFPESSQLVALPSPSKRLLLTTTFGLVVSDDDGATWSWVCEEAIGPTVSLYQPGAGAGELLYAVDADETLSVSEDGGRSWSARHGGLLAGGYVTDVFPHPTDPRSIIAVYLAGSAGPPTTGPSVILSTDAGRSFRVLYTAPLHAEFASLEVARSDPRTIYVTFSEPAGGRNAITLAQTADGGETWTTRDLTADVGGRLVRIAAVDPDDATKLYLRVFGLAQRQDTLAVLTERGATLTLPLLLDGAMTGFLRRANGDLLVTSGTAGAFRSTDGGLTFTDFAPFPAPRLRALAERDGVLYGGADNFRDGLAVAVSRDDGATWQRLLRYSEICGVLPSPTLAATCATPWQALVERLLITPAAACPAPPAVDAGTPPVVMPKAGCGCDGTAPDGALIGLVFGAFALARRRRTQGTSRALLFVALALPLVACGASVPIFSGPSFTADPPDPGPFKGLLVTTNSGDDTLSMLDPATGAVRFTVPVGLVPVELEGPHHATVDPTGTYLYVNLSEAVKGSGGGPHGAHGTGTIPGFVLRVRTADGRTDAKVQVDANPGDAALSPDGRTLYVTHYDLAAWIRGVEAGDLRQGDSNLVLVDTATMEVRARVPLCPAAHGVRVSADGTALYATCGPDEIAVVDLRTAPPVVTRVLLPNGAEEASCQSCPYALGVAPDGTVWVSTLGRDSGTLGGGGVLVYDPSAGAFDVARTQSLCGSGVFPSFAPGATPDAYTAWLPEQGSCGDALQSWVVSAGHAQSQPAIPLPRPGCANAHALELTPDGRTAFVVCEGDHRGPGTIATVDLVQRSVVRTTPVGVFPDSILTVP